MSRALALVSGGLLAGTFLVAEPEAPKPHGLTRH
jgi:hypothetical protein